MSKSAVHLTTSYQLIATGPAVFTVRKVGLGTISFDEDQNDDTAYRSSPDFNEQFQQLSNVNTYVKADRTGWIITVDGQGV